MDFTAEVERSLRVLDGGIVVLDAVAGVQPQSETVWRQANAYHVPRICFVNKMDRVGANFERTVDTIRHRLKANPVPIQLPLRTEDAFDGVVDLLEGKALIYENGGEVAPPEGPVPQEYREQFERYRETMIEKIVETDESLMIRYLEGEDIPPQDLRDALRKGTIDGSLVPVVCGTALSGRGVHSLLDAIIYYLPAPIDVPPVIGINTKTGQEVIREPREDEPLSALAFKVTTDPFVGRLVYLRIYSGTVKAGSTVYNSSREISERMGRVLQMHANRRDEVPETFAGNICAAVGLKNTFTGDTICIRDAALTLERPKFPQPVLSVAIEPMTRADQDKLSDALTKLSEEDPTFEVKYNDETGQTVISGMGELHLEVLVERIRREFNVEARVGKPKVAYREAITVPVRVEGRFVRQTGRPRTVRARVAGNRAPGAWRGRHLREPDRGRRDTPGIHPSSGGRREGGHSKRARAGFPMIDMKVSLVDGSYHQVDSSELSFKAAGSIAMREGAAKAKAILLEPIMEMEVVTPGEFLGDVLGDLNSRRAQIKNIEGQDGIQVVKALMPLGETFAYTTTLRSVTQGRASYTMEFRHYERVPESMMDEVVRRV